LYYSSCEWGADGFVDGACGACSDTNANCRVSCEAMSPESCVIVLSPYHIPCVRVSLREASIFTKHDDVEYTFAYYTGMMLRVAWLPTNALIVISLGLVQNLVVGAIIFIMADRFRYDE
jgi:hypothetical protein